MALAKKLKTSGKPIPRLYSWCGTEDFLYEGNKRAWEYMKELGYEMKLEESSGDHQWKYWDAKIQDVLRWWLDTDLETVRPLVCCMEASCIQLRNWSEKNTLTFISTAFRKMGFLSRPAKRFSFRVESCAICMPGKRHCMRAAMEPGISLQWIMISKKSVGIAVQVLA